MKKIILLFLVQTLAGSVSFGQNDRTAEYKDWLTTVAPIITRTERDVFLKLRTDADRDKFIRFFWKQRDPRPDTVENEFYKEYLQRVSFADQSFHEGTSQKGSRTERGYYYLLLGPPLERHLYTTHSQFWPLEVWFYKGEEQYGLPAYFYLMFYQPQGLGPYRLFSPTIDGPERLAVPTMTKGTLTRNSAYQAIKEVASEVASASLSYIPGERPLTSTSFSSDSLISNVRGLAEKKFSDTYARSYLEFKDHIETEYSSNYIDCSALIRIFLRDGQYFVDWTIEPEKMNFDTVQNFIYASYELVLKLEKPDGTTLAEKTEEIPLRLTPEQYKAHERQRVAFQDVLPVIPGEARLLLLLKNKTSKDFMSFQARLSIPAGTGAAPAGDILLYHAREDVPQTQKRNIQAFSLGGRHYIFNARNEFLPQEKMGLFFQSLSPTVQIAGDLRLEIAPLAQGSSKIASTAAAPLPLTRRFALKDVLDPGTGGIDLGTVPLSGLTPGYYQAILTALDGQGRTVFTRKENFILLASTIPILPWVIVRQHPPFPNAEALHLIGTQYFMSGDYVRAADVLTKAAALRDDAAVKLLLARTQYALTRYRESIALAEPLFRARHMREAGKLLALDHAALNDWPAALDYCEILLKESTEIAVLNLAAEGYVRMNQPDKALPLIRKSLQIDPAQPAVKALEERAARK
jgi:GWxTD domain-containing protein